MRKTHILWLSILAACTSDDGGTTATRVQGSTVYRDAMTEHDGTTREPEAPPAQNAKITVTVKGTGTLPQIDPQCATDPAGAFEAHYAGTMAITDGSAYAANIAEGSGMFTTPSGCTIGDLTVGVVTDVVVRAELDATSQNCTTYCAASARADAEAQCGASSSAATCRETAEGQLAASCMTECTQQSNKIVAETSIGASTLAHADADTLRAAALGELSAKLTFDHIEN
jgi:hypothetical protein